MYRGHRERVTGIAFHPTGEQHLDSGEAVFFASCGAEPDVYLWAKER